MDPKEGDYVRFKHERVETTGTVIKRSGTRIRVQPKDGGATLWKELMAAQSAQAVGERLTEMVRVRGGGCAASKPRAQAEPFIQDLDGPPRSPSLNVEQGAEATPEDVKVAEPVPETIDSAPTEVVEPRAQAEPFIQDLDGPPRSPSLTVEQGAEATPEDVKVAEPVPETTDSAPAEVVEPAAGAATEAEPAPAEARAETWNPIVEIGSSIIEAIVLAFALSVRNVRQAILKADNSPRQPMVYPNTTDGCALLPRKLVDIDPEVKRELSALDSDLAEVLGRGDIALVSAKWLKAQLDLQPDYKIVRRQDLKPVGGIMPHLTPEEAKRLLLEGRRAVGAFSLGWPTQGNPDPTGHRIQAFGRALRDLPDIEAFFWDYPSLYQNSDHSPRSDEQERAFRRGLPVINSLYGSAIGTTVLQLKELPPRPR
eukprot:jgi/Chrpa1/26451/Chrysochromulina_OHIO_Genome00009410-RA